MKKLVCLLILSLILLTGCGKKVEKNALEKILDNDVLVVGVKTDSKPFGYISPATGDYEGFDVDVARYIAKDLLGSERKIKFVEVNTNNRRYGYCNNVHNSSKAIFNRFFNSILYRRTNCNGKRR